MIGIKRFLSLLFRGRTFNSKSDTFFIYKYKSSKLNSKAVSSRFPVFHSDDFSKFTSVRWDDDGDDDGNQSVAIIYENILSDWLNSYVRSKSNRPIESMLESIVEAVALCLDYWKALSYLSKNEIRYENQDRCSKLEISIASVFITYKTTWTKTMSSIIYWKHFRKLKCAIFYAEVNLNTRQKYLWKL